MTEKGGKIKIESYKGPLGTIKGFEFTMGKIVSEGDEAWDEPMGPTPKPHASSMVFQVNGKVQSYLHAYL